MVNPTSQNMMKRLFSYAGILLCMAVLVVSCSKDDGDGSLGKGNNINANIPVGNMPQEVTRMEFPHVSNNGTSLILVHRTGDRYDPQGVNYCVEWDYKIMSQRWSCYQMHAGYRVNGISRYYSDTNQYPRDPELSSHYYLSQDFFYGSGFDHGHICPSADRLYSVAANTQTFYLTNMQPQYNSFNAGLWAEMENKVRTWTSTRTSDTLYVCKGGTIDGQVYEGKSGTLQKIRNQLLVPRFFYMALLLKNSMGYRAMAFWTDQNTNHNTSDLSKYAITIDELERRTGIDFFCNLPDDLERQVESNLALNSWGL